MARKQAPPPRPSPASGGEVKERVAKVIARAGLASRREAEAWIAAGRVAVNGATITSPALNVGGADRVSVDGKPLPARERTRLFLYHKPRGLLTTNVDERGRPTIFGALPKDLPRVVSVGRLDLNTEGLLLLTTDGELKRQLELPSSKIERTYRARAFGTVTQEQLESLIQGVEIEGMRYGPIDANMERRTGRNVWIELRLTEGKNREVRRVLEHLGLQVSRLIRIAYGPFVLADLPAGGVAEVRQHDLVAFRKGMRPAPPRDGEGDHAKQGGGAPAPVQRRGGPPPPRRGAPRSPSPSRGGSKR